MNIVLIGYGNVGENIEAVLHQRGFSVDLIMRKRGIYKEGTKIAEINDFEKYIDKESIVFISTPTNESSDEMYSYYNTILSKGAKVITCEKAVLAYHPELLSDEKVFCSATVGGDSGLLQTLSESAAEGEIDQVKAVVNGTLNYISERLEKGISKEGIFAEVMEKGFAEPGARSFEEVVQTELKDVVLKTVIMANVSGLYPEVIVVDDVMSVGYTEGKRCIVSLTKDEIRAGFVEDSSAKWLPGGVNAALYINGVKRAGGPGAGGKITAERMFKDLMALISHDIQS